MKQTKFADFFDTIDFFGASVPSHNFHGRHKIHTQIGVIMTLLVYAALLTYATVKLMDVVQKDKPISFAMANSFPERDAFAVIRTKPDDLSASGFSQ